MKLVFASLPCLSLASLALAQSPPMGGPMMHVEVHLNGTAVEVHNHTGTPPLLQNYGQNYAPPADVLNGLFFNAQYGWMVGGFWQLPTGASVWIEQTAATPGLRVFRAQTFAPIFGTSGSSPLFQWNGLMMHNWYAAEFAGRYTADYRVYIGDAQGQPWPGYTGDDTQLVWDLPGCRPDCDTSTGQGVLDIFDFLCFQNRFAAQEPYACDCDTSTGRATCDIFDFLCFQNLFSAGCP